MSECLMDFPHEPVWCPACYEQQQQGSMLREMRRANNLKEAELQLRMQIGDTPEWRPAPQPVRYVAPPSPVQKPSTELNGYFRKWEG
jgi:hypothetical protein